MSTVPVPPPDSPHDPERGVRLPARRAARRIVEEPLRARVAGHDFDLDDADNDGPGLVQYWRIVTRHKWGILGITLIGLIVGLLNAFSAIPIYRAETKLMASPILPNVDRGDQYASYALTFLFYETQNEIIQSHSVAAAAVDKLKLVEQHNAKILLPDRQPSDDPITLSVRISESIRSLKRKLSWRYWVPDEWSPPPPPEPTDDELRERFIAQIRAGLKVRGASQSQIINVAFESPDPKFAADVANAIADTYIDFGLSSRLEGVRKTASWLNVQLEQLEILVKESERELQSYRQATGLVDTGNQESLANERLTNLTKELVRAQTKRTQVGILHSQVQSLKEDGARTEALGTLSQYVTVRSLLAEEIDLRREVQDLSQNYQDVHPLLKQARDKHADAENSLQAEVDKVIESIRKDYVAATEEVRQFKDLIQQQKKEIRDVGSEGFELAQLERSVENNRRLYSSFLEKFQQADIKEDYDASNVQVVDPARVPGVPVKPSKQRMILISGVLGLFIGIGFAWLRESLDNTFKTTDHLEEKLGLASLGLVPSVGGRGTNAPARQVLNDSRSSFAENIHNIRTGLLFSSLDRPPCIIMVTSATGAEGKSALAVNLASSFGQLGDTLLLEGDLRKSSISKLVGVPAKPGLIEFLVGQATRDQCIHPTSNRSNDKLIHVMPCGTPPPNPLEVLSSTQFADALETLTSQYTYIVIDAPPVLAVSDPTVIGRLADAVVFAIRAETTTVKMAREALSRLQKSGVVPVGGVLCQTDARRMSYYGDQYQHFEAKYYGYAPRAKAGN